ncbi:MltA-interacting protein MipA [Bacteriovorax sp. BAL6_X]|uniref:MipA/OmpV family protein n=1 Tax=Bacteriovorax sp. BAL6_X TaxID=1201290 RepID=UPI000386E3B4|nr:MipA/OmpV family protein [Bacteriovorax sp. BAL6_X]EPZ50503.1 MltA-interacting protein MipA [Bacteriovorax sp. BAL6_X]
MKKILTTIFISTFTFASNYSPEYWGIGFGYRNASIPFQVKDKKVSDIIPLFYYKRGDFQLDGLSAHFTFYRPIKKLNINLMSKYRFFDIPKDTQNTVRGAGFDYGLEAQYIHSTMWRTRAQILTDHSTRTYFTVNTEADLVWKKVFFRPYAYATIRTAQFNNKYYGLDVSNPGPGYEIGTGVKAAIKVYKDFNILTHIKVSALDNETAHTSTIRNQVNTETFLGIGFIDPNLAQKNGYEISKRTKLKSKAFIRTAYAMATPSNLSDILAFHTATDKYNNDMVSFAYGIPMADKLLGANIPVYLLPQYVGHLKSAVQERSNEFALAVKIFIPFHWPTKWRLGLAEGISYADQITYIEEFDISGKGYRSSKFMNYLDFSIDFSLEKAGLKYTWLGLMIHHRSAIFESSSMFGRIKGGSNYIGAYIQQDL